MRRKNARVLLVDDDVRSAELLGEVLAAHGFVVTLVSSARSAIDELKQGAFDGVVMDMLFDGMPEGPQVLAAARELHPQAAVIVVTGYPAVEGAVSALKSGAVDYLTKPVDPSEIVGCLQRA
jgi:DNA-binding NtrC family response regulator